MTEPRMEPRHCPACGAVVGVRTTPREAECLAHIKAYWKACGRAPTIEFIRQAMQYKTLEPPRRLVVALATKRLITRTPGKRRSIQLVADSSLNEAIQSPRVHVECDREPNVRV